jgi:hypothetical protein
VGDVGVTEGVAGLTLLGLRDLSASEQVRREGGVVGSHSPAATCIHF